MGLFSSKKIINVSSTLYNMAGPEDERPNYLKGTLFSSVMANSPSLADDITTSYFEGPGLKQRQFCNYADRNDIAGLPTAIVTNSSTADPTVVAAEIPVNPTAPAGAYITVTNSQINDGDPEPFFIRWILLNHQARISEDWLGDYDPFISGFTVQFPNGDTFTFQDPQYSPDNRYIEARYLTIIDDNTQPEIPGTPQAADLNTYDPISSAGTVFSTTLVRNKEIRQSFSNGDPDQVNNEDASIRADLNRSVDVYEKTELVEVIGYQTEGEFRRLTYTGDDQKNNSYYFQEVTEVVDRCYSNHDRNNHW